MVTTKKDKSKKIRLWYLVIHADSEGVTSKKKNIAIANGGSDKKKKKGQSKEAHQKEKEGKAGPSRNKEYCASSAVEDARQLLLTINSVRKTNKGGDEQDSAKVG